MLFLKKSTKNSIETDVLLLKFPCKISWQLKQVYTRHMSWRKSSMCSISMSTNNSVASEVKVVCPLFPSGHKHYHILASHCLPHSHCYQLQFCCCLHLYNMFACVASMFSACQTIFKFRCFFVSEICPLWKTFALICNVIPKSLMHCSRGYQTWFHHTHISNNL